MKFPQVAVAKGDLSSAGEVVDDQVEREVEAFGPVMGLATMAGPILAGWLLHLDLFGSQWRLIFLINVPIGVLAWALGWCFLPHRLRHAQRHPAVLRRHRRRRSRHRVLRPVNHGGTAAFDHAGELVIALASGLYLITFTLVWLPPKHAQQAEH